MAEPEVGGRETERKEGVGRRLSLMLSTAASRSCPGVVLVASSRDRARSAGQVLLRAARAEGVHDDRRCVCEKRERRVTCETARQRFIADVALAAGTTCDVSKFRVLSLF